MNTLAPGRANQGLIVLLAFTGGWVDAVGYLVLLHLFTGHMSGNTIALTVHGCLC
jgi:uncharacterized membrane protein YoaK (UPF0700 family)